MRVSYLLPLVLSIAAFAALADDAPQIQPFSFHTSGGAAAAGACSATTPGLVPATGGGSTNFLRADCTFVAIPSAGVQISGTPSNTQIPIWTNSTTQKGTNQLTYDTGFLDVEAVANAGANGYFKIASNDNNMRAIVEGSSPDGSVLMEHCGATLSPAGGPFNPGMSLFISSGRAALVGQQESGNTTVPGLWDFWTNASGSAIAAVLMGTIDATANPIKLRNGTDASDPIARIVPAVSTADTNNATAVVADVTGATVVLAAASKYDCVAEGQIQNSTAAEGVFIQLTYSGTITVGSGVATLTSDAGVTKSNSTQAGASSVSTGNSSFSTGAYRMHHYLTTNAAGNEKVQFSESGAHVSGTATVYQGATLICTRM